MSSSGQLNGHEEREPISPAIPEEGIYEVKYSNKMTNVVRLLPNGYQERKLRKLADDLLNCLTKLTMKEDNNSFNNIKLTSNQHGTNITINTRTY